MNLQEIIDFGTLRFCDVVTTSEHRFMACRANYFHGIAYWLIVGALTLAIAMFLTYAVQGTSGRQQADRRRS
jgi:hypothetical protein